MRIFKVFLFLVAYFFLGSSMSVQAHESHDHASVASLIETALGSEVSKFQTWQDNTYRYIQSNGLPDHAIGKFPNENNPHAVSAQSYRFRMPISPKRTGRTTEIRMQPFGVALNGVVFDPGTAECYGRPRGGDRRGYGSPADCQWREEAIKGSEVMLGLDFNNAHVQPNGAYHYHGVPNGFVSGRIVEDQDLVHIGFAADGFRIYVSLSGAYKSSYRLREGDRKTAPGGVHDGTYTQDFIFDEGLGNLDECNGTQINNDYAYVLTTSFPYIPRCWKGTPDESFARRRPEGGPSGGLRGGRGGFDHRRGPPSEGHKQPVPQ